MLQTHKENQRLILFTGEERKAWIGLPPYVVKSALLLAVAMLYSKDETRKKLAETLFAELRVNTEDLPENIVLMLPVSKEWLNFFMDEMKKSVC